MEFTLLLQSNYSGNIALNSQLRHYHEMAVNYHSINFYEVGPKCQFNKTFFSSYNQPFFSGDTFQPSVERLGFCLMG